MHDLLTAFFALIFSLGHAQSLRHNEVFVSPELPVVHSETAPTRQQLALSGCTNGYAGSACPTQPLTIAAFASWQTHWSSADSPPDSLPPTLQSAVFSPAER